jgi:hypothetical protein
MANYVPAFRTSYFKVKDFEAFGKWVSQYAGDYEVWHKETEDHGLLVAFGGYDSIPSAIEVTDEDGVVVDYTDAFTEDMLKELSEHLEEGWVAILIEIGHEKLCYLSAIALMVNWRGKIRDISLNGRAGLEARRLGHHWTDVSY